MFATFHGFLGGFRFSNNSEFFGYPNQKKGRKILENVFFLSVLRSCTKETPTLHPPNPFSVTGDPKVLGSSHQKGSFCCQKVGES
jgi:hypothetical protein